MKAEDHPLGFRKFVLIRCLGYRLRLHVWPKGKGSDTAHNHRWWFISIPLFGRFVDTRYSETPEGEGFLKIDVHDKDGIRDGDRIYRARERSGLEPISRKTRYPLVPYLCRIGQIHSFAPMRPGLHASLVIVGRLRSQTSEVWHAPDVVDTEPMNSRIDQRETR